MPFYVLFADNPDGYFDPAKETFVPILLSDLRDQQIVEQMCFYYTGFEFCNALRPFLHEYLFRDTELGRWLYLDSDVLLQSSLDPVFEAMHRCSLLLSPHLSKPAPPTHIHWQETNLLSLGIFNSGCLGLTRSPVSESFIRWFKERLTRFCFDREFNTFVDQLWLNMVPAYFEDWGLLRHPGANVAYWNLHERSLECSDSGQFSVNGEPLIFFHFSGWEIEEPYAVSKHGKFPPISAPSCWPKLGDMYREALLRNGYQTTMNWPYSFDTFSTGEPITKAMRRQYYAELAGPEKPVGSPFEQASRFVVKEVKEPPSIKRFIPGRCRAALRELLRP
jgi:hypothetical protein